MKKLNLNIVILSSAFIILLSLLSNSVLAQGHSDVKVDPDARKEWIKQVRKSLKEMNPDLVPIKVKLKTYERDGMIHQKYRINKAGLIPFNSNDWIYVTLHSQHDDDRIGDLAIAKDQDGKYYYHLGHVCGGIVNYEATSKTLFTGSGDFFKYFKDDVYDLHWHRLKRNSIPVISKLHD